MELLHYIEENRERFLQELLEFLKIPSISSMEEHNNDMLRCAEWLKNNLIGSGIANARIVPTKGHPIVYAELLEAGFDAPTVMVYGHYDVQPVDPIEQWYSNPFEPEIRDGKLWGRGTSDDKGQVFVHVKAVESILKTKGKLPVNVKFLIEGEEEAGSSNLDEFVENNAGLLKCDTALISDTEWFADGLPSICYSLRGISFIEVKITGPNRDLHSGTFGGAVDNPANVLCWLVARLKDRYGRITIPGFYDEVLELTDEERSGFKKLPFDENDYKHDLSVNALFGELGYTTLERSWARPSLDVNGIFGGYTGKGAKTIIPSSATAKISMRLVPHQKSEDITNKIEKYLKTIAPPTVSIDVTGLHGGSPVLAPLNSKGVKAAQAALKEAFGIEPVFMRDGGSIPILEVFQKVLNAPSVLMGLGLPGDNIHSPNENYDLNNFFGGIKASALFFEIYKSL